MPDKRDYYDVLGVSKTASQSDVKRAYRRLAKELHPDRNKGAGAEERFKEVQEAYDVLGDPDKRRQYDTFGHAGVGAGPGGFGGPGFDVGDIFGDIFGDFFGGGGGRRAQRARRGSDLQYRMVVTFEEAAFGTEKKITIPRIEQCGECHGRGARNPAGIVTCASCNGSGQMLVSQGFFQVRTTCRDCRGQGRTVVDPCRECRGAGRVERERHLDVAIPAGIDSDTRLKLSGEGEAGENGGPRGDLYVLVQVQPHDVFERRGDDILIQQPISFSQAALGCELEVPTLRGPAKLTIPKGIQSGKILRMKDMGIDSIRGRGRGSQLVLVQVVTPRTLSAREEELFQELAQITGDSVEKPRKGFLDLLREAFE